MASGGNLTPNSVHNMHLQQEGNEADKTNDLQFDSSILRDAVVHLFLPKQTPSQSQPNLEEIEQFFLHITTNSIKGILKEVPFPQLKWVELMLEKWKDLQPNPWNRSFFVKHFPIAVHCLQQRESIPLYIRDQNSAIHITKHCDNSISFSTFRCSLPSEVVMSNVQDEFSMGIPETMEIIQNTDMLASQSFAKLLHELSNGKVDGSLENVSKNGYDFTSSRNVPDPKLVSDWIVGLLIPQEDSTSLKISKLQKKFRDQVTFNENRGCARLLPFRRSGMYMALKAVIQLELEETLENKQEAKLVYKIVMLQVLTDFAAQFPVNDMITMDLATQILAKLGRRVQKLEQISSFMSTASLISSSDSLMTLKTNSINHVLSTVKHLTSQMKTIWDSITAHHINPKDNHLLLPFQHNDDDFHHVIPKLDSFIQKLKEHSSPPFTSVNKSLRDNIESEVLRRYTTLESILDAGQFPLSSSSYVWLYDTENFIKYECTYWDQIEFPKISKLFTQYISQAKLKYDEDPLGKSQIYLVSLKSLEILDQLITKAFPMLLEYKPEVNLNIFDHLLLPYKNDMDLLDELVLYFKNREKNAPFPGLLNRRCINANAFSVQYATKNGEMIALRNKILQNAEKAIVKKYKEIDTKIEYCNSLQAQINDIGLCTCVNEMTTCVKQNCVTESVRKILCTKCQLEITHKNQRKSVARYERPLPPEETLQWAVIFELLIPSQFSIYRDYLAYAKYEIWGDRVFHGYQVKEKKLWLEYNGVKSNKSVESGSSKNIQLGSPTVPLSSSFLTKTSALDVLNEKKEKFIINNGMDCLYYYIRNPEESSKSSIESECSFKLHTTSNHECYSQSNLQIALESTNHTQNSILARQNECHQKLSLEEFITFGSLRAGHRIQLRNLYQAIVNGTLSLEQESVLALILQTIWQLGALNETTNERECHLDFSCEDASQFAEEFLEMLDKLVKTNEANYSNSLILIVCVAITKRIAELNASLELECHDFLKRLRKIMFGWISKIETALDKPDVASSHEEVSSLRRNLLEIITCLMLSYSVSDEQNISTVLKDQEDVVFWLQTLYHWNQLENQPIPTSPFFTILQNFVKVIPLRLKLEKEICSGGGNSLIVSSLESFICQRWYKAKDCVFKQLNIPFATGSKASLVLVEYLEVDEETGERITHQITFDFIRGTFLINGYSQTTLPLEIKDHKLFNIYFKDTTSLRIQRENAYLVRTILPFHGKHYEFTFMEDTLIIKEIEEGDPVKLVLLDPQTFSTVLSTNFIDNYSHWLDITKECVYFRPIANPTDHNHHLILQRGVNHTDSSVWTLFDEISEEHILSIYSNGFTQITNVLKPLDLPNHLNITHSEKSSTITATLRRYNIRFTLNLNLGMDQQLLQSVEYPGYQVPMDQKRIPTFVGLKQGLLLENGEKQLILMPHSTIKYDSNSEGYHQICSIDLSEHLRQPPYFVYEVDDVLKRLKAHNSKSAWLYLAALHAVTSSPFFPDPFTGVTGTEMGVMILQSACVWSCSPYDEESLETLNFVKSLSPKRKWYGQQVEKNSVKDKGSMEITEWPEGLPTMVAYDGFAIIVEKLIEESEKLKMLYTSSSLSIVQEDETEVVKLPQSPKLRLRGYFRHLSFYNSTAALEYPKYFTYLQQPDNLINYLLPIRISSENSIISNLQTMSFVFFTKSVNYLKDCGLFKKNNLTGFLLTREPLSNNHRLLSLDQLGVLQDLLALDLRFNWLKLYNMAINCKSAEELHLLGIVLLAAAYRGAPLQQIVNLHCISVISNNNLMKFPSVPEYETAPSSENTYYSCPIDNEFDEQIVYDILTRYYIPIQVLQVPVVPVQPSPSNPNYAYNLACYEMAVKEYLFKKEFHERYSVEICIGLTNFFKQNYWPCESISMESMAMHLRSGNYMTELVASKLNEKLGNWYRNYRLKLFVEEVQHKLNTFWDNLESFDLAIYPSKAPLELQLMTTLVHVEKEREKGIEGFDHFIDVSQSKELAQANLIFKTGNFVTNRITDVSFLRIFCEETIEKIQEDFGEMLTISVSNEICYCTGITPRLTPVCVLKILEKWKNVEVERMSKQQRIAFVYAGALGVLWTHLKRFNRCIRAQNEMDIDREMENLGHSNWSPEEYPEWLLLELELDIMIRPIQVKVAQQMIQMPGRENGVTQLNMGEGKTSVIVPMLCATLAQKNSQLCRVTVLSSMFKMNLNSLTFSIGGLLNKRVYSVPCKRDMQIDQETVNTIQQVYQECLEMEGVILTLPEYRLSFRLLAYDKMYKKEWMLGQVMLNVENFLRHYARDVLDESDELFSVKYQLVYTIGEQIPVDGGDLRWILSQKILDIVSKVGTQLSLKYGTGVVEFHEEMQKERPHEFSTFRLLGEETCLKEFNGLVADLILEELKATKNDREAVRNFISDENVKYNDYEQVIESIFGNENPDGLNQVLILAGYLRQGVLGLALTKRWRVEYGVNPKPDFPRLMAVPFRAKDVAAEKTEFGHPDLAIILTHLSYYYSGLSDNQLQEVFHILKRKKAPCSLYAMWISKIPKKLVPEVLENYFSLNVKDVNQTNKLFQMLRKHKMVIDFWLSNCVFPRESKQFPGKLVMTAWDLCYERQRLPVTGFSGTNDSQVLLPLMIAQQDLGELQSTNENMEKTLLQPENGMNHKGFPMGVTCEQVLESMKQDQLTVLIDAGALMLECSNEQIANLWLKVNSSIEAVVFFNENNELLVKSREYRSQDIPFVLSPYQGRLEKCGVFLDDQHTRGTDLKFPVGSKACVTVATRMKRDKLIQACMRMRKLGHGHSVTFYLSHEAHDKIGGGEITTEGVLDWVCQNTKESNQDGLLYWALAGRNYAQRLAAEDHFHFPHHKYPCQVMMNMSFSKEQRTEVLTNQCIDTEIVSLMDMYGQFTQMELLIRLIPIWFEFTKLKLQGNCVGRPLERVILFKFDQIRDAITQKCFHFVPFKMQMFSKCGGMMEEEQEKELELEKEVEVEEEREVERPPRATPVVPYLKEKVKKFAVSGGQLQLNKNCIWNISRVFNNTSFWDQVQPKCWPLNVFVTKEFVSTISTNFKTDLYLRPIQYMISYETDTSNDTLQLLVISSFEANELLPIFRNSASTKCKLHMFSTRRSEKQDLLLNNKRLQLPLRINQVSRHVIPPLGSEVASLLLASGNLYFASMEEQKTFLRFLGLFPQPWGKLEKAAFELGWITKSGFWGPEFGSTLHQTKGFQKDPTGLVRKILMCRHSVLSEVSHLVRILNEQRCVQFSS